MSQGEKTLRDALLIDLSRRVSATIQAQPYHCATNAWRAMIHFPNLFQAGGRLVEGWFVIEQTHRITMNEHMWCELVDGQIVDPSVLLLVAPDTPVYYFTGLTRSWAEAEALENEIFPYVCFDGLHGRDGLGHAGYRAAREVARRKVYALAMQRQPPKEMQFLTAQDLDHVLSEGREILKVPVIEGDPLDLERSLRVSHVLPAVLGRCWYNAREALWSMPSEFLFASYVEGWLVSQEREAIRICEHGWIWHPRSGVIDPTIVLEAEVPDMLAYFPGLRLSWAQIQQYLTHPLPLARHIPRFADLAYREACKRAQARAEALAWQTGLPVLVEPGMVTTFRGMGKAVVTIEQTSWDFPVPASPSAHVTALLQEMAGNS